jgi:hypothetical protein
MTGVSVIIKNVIIKMTITSSFTHKGGNISVSIHLTIDSVLKFELMLNGFWEEKVMYKAL